MVTVSSSDECDCCGGPGASVTVYANSRMSHYHAACRPEKEHSPCAERHQWSIEQWLKRGDDDLK